MKQNSNVKRKTFMFYQHIFCSCYLFILRSIIYSITYVDMIIISCSLRFNLFRLVNEK